MAIQRPTGQGQAHPKRNEIYLTAFDPTIGSEITKTRPATLREVDQAIKISLNVP